MLKTNNYFFQIARLNQIVRNGSNNQLMRNYTQTKVFNSCMVFLALPFSVLVV